MRSLALLVLVAGLSAPVFAQDAQAPSAPQEPAPQQPATTASEAPIDPTKLGVSLSRIRKGLFVAAERDKQTGDGIRLEFNVQVYGTAPKIEVLKGVDLYNGGVPGSAPTHRQMIDFVTPVIYRTPAMPVSALAYWAANQIWQKSKKSACEEEIANYRALIMQGVSVSAPRCTQ
jgi:hypothetical protein